MSNRTTNTRMVVNELLQDAKGNSGLYHGPVLVDELSAFDRTTFLSDDPDAPPPPLADFSMNDDTMPIPHGKNGQMVYLNHKDFLKYTGDWDHCCWTRGTCLYTNGNVYTGPWNSGGQPHGDNGKQEWVVISPAAPGGEDMRTYEGDWLNGMRHGHGTYIWRSTGAVYKGAFDSNQRQGHGSYRDPTTQVEYVGEWKEGVYHGHGQYTWSDNQLHEICIYRGTFYRGQPHGQGIQVNRLGEVIHYGAWEHGKPVKKQEAKAGVPHDPVSRPQTNISSNASLAAPSTVTKSLHVSENTTPADRRPPGVAGPEPITALPSARTTRPSVFAPATASITVVHDCAWKDSLNQREPTMGIYRGLWLHKNPFQNGVVIYATGEYVCYEGWFNSEGYYHGQGCRLTLRNGDNYIGDFDCGLRHGNGMYTWNDGRQYKGTFIENACHGKGTLVYPNSDFYEGQFVQGEQQGHGRLIFANGSVYEGMWRAGQFQGQGTLVEADGSIYIGEFHMGVKHGQGKAFNQMGVAVYEGMYYMGYPKTAQAVNPNTWQHKLGDLPHQQVQKQASLKQSFGGESPTAVECYWVDDDRQIIRR